MAVGNTISPAVGNRRRPKRRKSPARNSGPRYLFEFGGVDRGKRASEAQVQQRILEDLAFLGAKTYNLSQGRRTGTRQTPGLADVFAFVPLPNGRVAALWVEVKRPERGKVRPEQHLFQALCKLAGVEHVLGGLSEVATWCARNGLVAPDFVKSGDEPGYARWVRSSLSWQAPSLIDNLTAMGPLVMGLIEGLHAKIASETLAKRRRLR